MVVYRDYEVALEEMESSSAKIKEDVYLCYISYGRHPKNLEFQLRTTAEMVNPKKPTNCLAVYRVGKGLKIMKDIKKLKESKEFKDETIISYPCGSFAPSWKNSVVELGKCINV
ncbi:MAG: hypothetical protein ACK5MH_00450 [Bacteroidales bacterium]